MGFKDICPLIALLTYFLCSTLAFFVLFIPTYLLPFGLTCKVHVCPFIRLMLVLFGIRPSLGKILATSLVMPILKLSEAPWPVAILSRPTFQARLPYPLHRKTRVPFPTQTEPSLAGLGQSLDAVLNFWR